MILAKKFELLFMEETISKDNLTWGLPQAGPLTESEKEELEKFYNKIIKEVENDPEIPDMVSSTV